MSWLKWILAYLFDCVHPHTTWPRRNATGIVYVCCVDCGRELPYSLKYMSIITRVGRNRKASRTSSIATLSRVLISVMLLFNSGRAAAQISNESAAEAVNFYQSKGLIHGRSQVLAADPTHTKRVWSQIEELIEARMPPAKQTI